MSNQLSATSNSVSPSNWHQEAQARWLLGDKQGAIDEIIAVINRESALGRLLRVPCLQMAYYLFQLGDFIAGEAVLTQLLNQDPNDVETLENRAVMRSRAGNIVAAARDFQVVVEINPQSVNAWDGLTSSLSQLAKWDEARQAGEQSLNLKALNCRNATQVISWPSVSPQIWDARHSGQDIIAFSLWGENPIYLRGAVRNLLEAPNIYPGWTCRFYVDDTVPKDFIAFVLDRGGQVAIEPSNCSLREKLCWRFQVASDPSVRRFLVRDADSVINTREAKAVAQWLESDCWFHIMRDYWTHTDLILAGMWGGRSGLLPELMPFIRDYQSGRLETANIDQWFLRDWLWPIIYDRSFIHDRIFRTLNAHLWPELDPIGNFHVGQNEAIANPALQAAKLGKLIGEYPWLNERNYLRKSRQPVVAPKVTAIPTSVDSIFGLWINLDRAIERRQSMEQQLEAAGLATGYQRVAGVDGTKIAPHLARPGVIGCWLSHLQAIELGRDSGKVVHIMEDDTLLGNFAKDLFQTLANAAALKQYDIIFTDVLFDYLTAQRYFRAFYEAAQQVKPGGFPAQFHSIDLREILFTCMNSYLIHPQRIGKISDLLHQIYQTLDPLNPEPIDMVIRRLVRSGALRAAVTCPFLTSCQLQVLGDSQIENPSDFGLHHSRWLHSVHRQAFFYGADDQKLLTQLTSQFPTQLSTPKSQLLGLLYEQFLTQDQQSF